MKMPKFRNKRTGKVIEENLLYYVNKYRNHPDYEEIKEVEKNTSKEEKKKEVEKKAASQEVDLMTLYVNKEYYSNVFKGNTISDEDIEKYLELAQEKIDSITFNRIVAVGFDNLTEFQKEKISKAICYQAEYIFQNGYNDEENREISSYSVLDISVSVDNSNENKTKAQKMNMSEIAYDYVHKTGLDGRIL